MGECHKWKSATSRNPQEASPEGKAAEASTAFALDSVIELISAGVLIWRLRDELRRGEAFYRHTERIASLAAFDVHFDQRRRVAAKLDKRVDRDDVDADRAGRIKSSRRGVRAALN
jgi:hypothetical protein